MRLNRIAIIAGWGLMALVFAGLSEAEEAVPRRALAFDGKSGHVSASLSAPLDGDLTLEAWICNTAPPEFQERIVALGGKQGALQLCRNSGRYLIDNSGGPLRGVAGPPGCNDGRWHHVVVKRYERTTYALHVDGIYIDECKGTTPTYTAIHLGLAPGQPRFKGLIGEVRLYDRCLTNVEVTRNYTEAKGIVTDGLVGWWKLDGDVKDSVGGNHGEGTGALNWVPGRGKALFDRPRIRARFFPEPARMSVEVDARQMGPFPPDASWEIVLRNSVGAVVKKQRVAPMPAGREGAVFLTIEAPVPGEHEVAVRVLGSQEKQIGKSALVKVAVSKRPAWTKRAKVLNNLVMELLNVGEHIASGNRRYTFLNPRDGWVFFSATAADSLRRGDRVEIRVNALPEASPLIVQETGAERTHEAMRYLPAGEHALNVSVNGQASLNSLVVRAVPEIIFGEFGDRPRIRQYGLYDLAFLKRIGMLRNVNTIQGCANFENKAPPFCHEWQKQGGRWIGERTKGTEKTAAAAAEFWMHPITVTQPFIDGLLIDEFMQFKPMQTEAAKMMLADKRFEGKLFYPYVCSPVPRRGGEEGIRLFRLVMDSGNRVAWERYLQEQPDEADAWNMLNTCVRRQLQMYWLKPFPDAPKHVVMVFGNYLSGPPESLNVHPTVDYKVWMDMQYHLVANDPLFFGLYGLMEYGLSCADEEHIRWAARLYRHYAIEGRTEMLSPQYGFRYRLTHVRNPDFDKGLDGWTLKSAGQGSIGVRKFNEYSRLQGRYPTTTQGDRFLWMKRSADGANAVSQEITGLVPGRLYSLKMFTGDYGDLVAGASEKKTHAVSIGIDNAEFISPKCFQTEVCNPWYTIGTFTPQQPFWVNFHGRVFRPKGNSAKLTISDWLSAKDPGGPIGQEIICNFLELQPHLEE